MVFTAETAAEWGKRGREVILVRLETSPEDIEGMNYSKGILTARGGMTSHAAVVARGMGKCCVSGCSEIKIDEKKPSCSPLEAWRFMKEIIYIFRRIHRKNLCWSYTNS